MKRSTILLLASLTLGCAARQTPQIHSSFVIDASFSAEQINGIVQAIGYWDNALGSHSDVSIRSVESDRYAWPWDGASTIYNAQDGGWRQATFERLRRSPSAIALAVEQQDIFVGNCYSMFVRTIMHEIGHVYGLPHVLNKYDIMYPQALYSVASISWVSVAKIKRERLQSR